MTRTDKVTINGICQTFPHLTKLSLGLVRFGCLTPTVLHCICNLPLRDLRGLTLRDFQLKMILAWAELARLQCLEVLELLGIYQEDVGQLASFPHLKAFSCPERGSYTLGAAQAFVDLGRLQHLRFRVNPKTEMVWWLGGLTSCAGLSTLCFDAYLDDHSDHDIDPTTEQAFHAFRSQRPDVAVQIRYASRKKPPLAHREIFARVGFHYHFSKCGWAGDATFGKWW